MLRPLFALLLFAYPLFAQDATTESSPDSPAPDSTGGRKFERIAIVHLRDAREAIDDSLRDSVLRRMEEARQWGADLIIFDIQSYGGYVPASLETGDKIFNLPDTIHTIAYVEERAISGAALIALACREIVMSRAGQIGDAQAILIGPGGFQKGPEKIQAPVAAAFRKYARGNGYPVPVAEAMVREELEIVRYRKAVDPDDPSKGTEWVYYRDDREPPAAERSSMGLTDREIVVPEGELAIFGAHEAMDYDICSRIEPVLESLLERVRAPGAVEMKLQWTWAERTSRWLIGMRGFLFFLGIGALYFALKTPGTGIPEVLALIAWGLYFGAAAVADFAGSLEIILFFAGVVLIIVEIFLLPGFGVPGIVGFVLLLTSVAMAAVPEAGSGAGSPGLDTSDYLIGVAGDFLLGTFASGVAIFFLAKHIHTLPLFRRLALEGNPAAGTLLGSALAPTAEGERAAVGQEGVADTGLRPAGRATIEGRRRDVVTEGAFIDQGARVRIVQIDGNRIVVRRIEDAGEEQA